MIPSFEIGSIRGIRIGINWSLLVIFALIAWTLWDDVFPAQNPGLGRTTYVAMAFAAAILFFASILAHELGHAFQARREGMEIDGITLWLFGGVARFRGAFPTAGGELRIALAGPGVTLVIGLACVGIARIGLPDAIDGVAAWLGYINLLLLVFNLLPALPLDGGRVLRALLWHVRGDPAWATGIAARTGQAIGVAMIVAGGFLLVFSSVLSGAWLAFIGWFVLMAAGDELRATQRQRVFGGVRVRDVMVRDPITVQPEWTVGALHDAMTDELRQDVYPVVDGSRAVGLLPYALVVQAPREQWETRRVADFALPLTSVPTVAADVPLAEAAPEVVGNGLGRALVLEGERLVGLLSLGDVLGAAHRSPLASRR